MEEEERTFTPGQAEAMDALLSGRNVFLSGNAGTGKSYVLNAFIEELEEREGEARLLPQCLSPFIPPHQGVPRQVGSRDVRMEERQALRCHHSEGDLRRGDLLLCAEDRRQWGLLLGHELWKALGAAREGHRKTGGPSLIC